MSEEMSGVVIEAEAPADSTVVKDAPAESAPEHKPAESRDDAITKALDEQESKQEEKPEPEKKPEPKEEEDKEEEGDEEKDAKEEEKPAKEPRKKPKEASLKAPDNFLPAAKEKWGNVPYEVRGEVHRAIKEAAEASEQYREASERYESVREFDEAATRNGGSLRDSLTRVAQIEGLMQQNPLAGLNAILMEAGPRKADGQPVSLYELANAIVKMGPQGYNQQVQRVSQPQQQGPNEVEQLRGEIERMKAEAKVNPVIESFRANHPRYDELEPNIAKFLKSGMVPHNLSVSERLSAAYDMAARISPSADGEPEDFEDEDEVKDRAAKSFAGSRSIKGSPPSGAKTQPKRRMSRDESISAAMAAFR